MEKHTYIPIARLESKILIVSEDDVPKIGKPDTALEVQALVLDTESGEVTGPELLERMLKFNPWEELDDETIESMKPFIQGVIAKASLDT